MMIVYETLYIKFFFILTLFIFLILGATYNIFNPKKRKYNKQRIKKPKKKKKTEGYYIGTYKKVFIDKRGYYRYKKDNRLVHRDIMYSTYKRLYNTRKLRHRYSYYVIHHIDHNKRNNRISNLMILTPEQHRKIHGFKKNNWRR